MLLAVDKPHGISSFWAISKLKRLYPKNTKIWHSGTLDPFATGLMLIGVWPDTKKLTELTWLDKSYVATIDFSQDSDTRDLQYRDRITKFEAAPVIASEEKQSGAIIKNEKKISAPSLDQITEKLDTIVPSWLLPIPTFSAKKKDGKRSYDLARKGKAVEESKEMKIYSYKIITYEFPLLELEIEVGSGTYIRSIAHRLGEQFGLGGILTALRRTKVWNYELKNYTFKEIEWTDVTYCEIE